MTAAEEILRKKLVASDLPSDGWNGIQADLRNRAFFSARVTEARFLHEAREGVAQIAAGKRSASELRRDLRAVLDAVGAPEGSGDITDPRSRRRLDLIIDTNVRQARGYVNYLEGTTPGALAAFPAQELVRLFDRREKRPWPRIWELSGGKFYGGRMIALKSDPIWTRISRFGNPYPPFDFNSGMGVEDVSRSEAISLGVIDADDPPPKVERKSLNDTLEAEVPFNEYSDEWKNLKKSFGSQIQMRGHHIRWNEGVIQALLHGEKAPSAQLGKGEFNPELLRKIPDASLREEIRGRGLTITRQWIETHGRRHRDPSGKGGLNLPLTDGDYSLIPAMWRSPDSVTVDKRGWLALHLETLDGGVLTLGVNVKKGQPTTFRKEKGPLHDDRE